MLESPNSATLHHVHRNPSAVRIIGIYIESPLMDILWNRFIFDNIVSEMTQYISHIRILFAHRLISTWQTEFCWTSLSSKSCQLIIQSKLCSPYLLQWRNTSCTESLSSIADCYRHGSHLAIKLNKSAETSNCRYSDSNSICYDNVYYIALLSTT